MQIKLFDIDPTNKNVVLPTEHCYTITPLKAVIDMYGDDAGRVLAYLYYMFELDPTLNPYANMAEELKEEHIIREVVPGVDVVDVQEIDEAKETVLRLFNAIPGYRMYLAYKTMWDKMAEALEREYPDFSKDGNMNNIKSHYASYKQMKESLDAALKDYQAEVNAGKVHKRGGGETSYDIDEHEDLD